MDALDLVPNKKVECMGLGEVELIDVMPRIVPDGQTCDYAIAQAARVSYGDGTKSINEDRGLVRFLMRHQHSTPTEMVVAKFRVKLPIFVARQAVRHRMCSINEISARYSVMKEEFYIPAPECLRRQSKTNKQGSEGQISQDIAEELSKKIEKHCKDSYALYKQLLDSGVAREQARMVLPLNLYTEWYWKQDLHNLLHFLALRADSHAQEEIQDFANAMLKLMKPLVPWTIEAWEDYHILRGAMKLTKLEIEAMRKYNSSKESLSLIGEIDTVNKREQDEWKVKAKELGFEV